MGLPSIDRRRNSIIILLTPGTLSHEFYQPMKPRDYEDSYGQMGNRRVIHTAIESWKAVLELGEGRGVV